MFFSRYLDRCVIFIFIRPPSHCHVLIIKKKNENKSKNHTLIYNFDEDSFACRNGITLYIIYLIEFNLFKLK